MHVIAAKAVAFHEALQPDFLRYSQEVIDNARVLGDTLSAGGLRLVTGGTDCHLLLADLRPFNVAGNVAVEALERCGLTANKNAIPFDRSEEHTSELQSLMRISYAVFCLKKQKNQQ